MYQHHEITLLSWLPLTLVIGVFTVYLTAVLQQMHLGRSWSGWRLFSFALGSVLLSIALWPSIHASSMHDIRFHMAQHLLIGMMAPIGLVFGTPLTLCMRTLPKSISQKLVRILHSQPIRWLTHPITALILDIGGMALFYLTPLYLLSLTNSSLHILMHLHFLLAGYLFTWAIAGPDPAPKRPGSAMRLTVLFIAMASHANLSKFMYAYLIPQNTPHPFEHIQWAAKLMYYGGDFSELLLAVLLFYSWHKKRARTPPTSPSPSPAAVSI